eukprot:GHVS01042334.1.p1 GENE.GHVS01042334.1~~GHVS01042334.1.p1  ORF type:complete len:322 (-),score=51.87 GHVS01042334.1:1370-2335(-)
MDAAVRDSYYEILGLESPQASADQIRAAYYGLCKRLHPDKATPSEQTDNQDHRSQLRAVQCAYKVLSDNTKRARYDIRNGFYNHSDKLAKLVEVERIQKEKAQSATEMMGSLYETVYKREVERRGVLIDKSWYGNFRLKQNLLDSGYKGPVTCEHVEGPWIDVTIPLQCQVNGSRLIIPGGPSSSKSDVDGFYNPTANIDSMDLCLYILYHFQGDLHEVTVTDKQSLAIPLKSHKLTTRPSGPFDPSNLSTRRPNLLLLPSAAAGEKIAEKIAGPVADENWTERNGFGQEEEEEQWSEKSEMSSTNRFLVFQRVGVCTAIV